MPPTWKQLLTVSFFLLCALVVNVAQSLAVQAASPLAQSALSDPNSTIFINEFHYDNAGTDSGEFVEVAGPAGADLTGWSIVLYNGSNGTFYDTDALPTSIPNTGCPYGFVTISYPQDGLQNGSPDGIALVNNGTVVQFLSYEGGMTATNGVATGIASTAITAVEGSATPVGQSLQLTGSGTTYGNFTWSGPSDDTPGAINTGQDFGPCSDVPPTVDSVIPAVNSVGIALDAVITINFSEPVTTTGAWFDIQCTISGSHEATPGDGGATHTLDPFADFAYNERCTVTLFADKIHDLDGTPHELAGGYAWSFDTLLDLCNYEAVTPINEVQGSGIASPLAGSSVIIKGVVVGDFQGTKALDGFYLQEEDAEADTNPLTAEGIFVFDNTPANGANVVAVSEGDVVAVRGTVIEFGTSGNSLTEISPANQVQFCAPGTGTEVTPVDVVLPVASLTALEQFEGMRVNLPQQLTVSENFTLGRFGEIVLAANDRLYQPTHLAEPGAPAQAIQASNNLNRILLDDGKGVQNPDPIIHPTPYLSATNTLRTGDKVENVTGVLEQRFALYRIQPLAAPTYIHANPRPATPSDVGGTLKVATANVLNYFTTFGTVRACGPLLLECRGATNQQEFDRQRAKIINGLGTINADIVGLLEIENNEEAAVADLVAGLNTLLGAGTYAYIDTGFIGTDAIKVALIYKPATVSPVGDYKILDSSVNPIFIDTKNRPALAQTFQENATGERFTVAVNHLKSKGSDCNDVGDPNTGDGQGNCNITRKNAAIALVDWLESDPTGSGDTDFLIIGDLNSYAMEDPIDEIKAGGYTDLFNRFHGTAAYSYVFQGQTGYLDHALANASLNEQVTGVTEWHVNADEPIALDYNLDFQSEAQKTYLYTPQPYRFSDHDPLVVGLDLESETTITIVKDARPNNLRNFRFSGDLGNFRLDDPGFNDNDPVNSSKTFDVNPGTYTVAEEAPHFWHLTSISCTGGSATVNLANQSVAITVAAGQNVTCTFTNQYGSAIWVDKYHDSNANGRRFWEIGLPGWKMSLYNSAGTLVAADTTNLFGKVHFWNVAPGQYTLCETQKSGWFNSQPGTINPAFGNQPCYTLNIGPAQLWYVEFGNHRNARATTAEVVTPDAPTTSELVVEDVDDESYADDGTFVDPDLHRPDQDQPGPLFLPQITR